MEESKSITKTHEEDDNFLDADDEFPFYDCTGTDEQAQSVSPSSSISHVEQHSDLSSKSKFSPRTSLRRRRSFSQHVRKDASSDGTQNSSPSFQVSDDAYQIYEKTTPRERKLKFIATLNDNDKENVNPDSLKVRLESESSNNGAYEENKENSTVTTANDERIDESDSLNSFNNQVVVDESSSDFLFVLARLVIRAIGFQLNLLISFFTCPIRLLYYSFLFVIDPFRIVRRGREFVVRKFFKLLGTVCGNVTPFIYEWLKEQTSIWKLALQFGWGLLWSAYVCFILISLLVSSFVVSSVIMKFCVEEPIQMKETLNFDYTKNSPVAFVPILSCPNLACGLNCEENSEIGSRRVIPVNHKLQATISLTLPESNYNRNLGIFQVRVDLLSANGKAVASSRRPCMLKFKSRSIDLLSTFLKVAPLMAGYLSESQTVNVEFRGFSEADTPTACLRVIIEQRAEYRPGAGIPEIYAASLTLESELPLLKRFLWYWKKTIYIWTSLMLFTVELFFALICCKPIIMPRIRLRGGSANNSAASRNNLQVLR